MSRVKVKMLPSWHVYVDNVAHGPGDVVEVAPDHAAVLVARGVAVEVVGRARGNASSSEASDQPRASEKGRATKGDPPTA